MKIILPQHARDWLSAEVVRIKKTTCTQTIKAAKIQQAISNLQQKHPYAFREDVCNQSAESNTQGQSSPITRSST